MGRIENGYLSMTGWDIAELMTTNEIEVRW